VPASGIYVRLTRNLLSVAAAMVSDRPWTAPLALLGVLVPLITLVNYGKEADFVRQWSHRMPVMTVEAAA
jgi:hypothetical protein